MIEGFDSTDPALVVALLQSRPAAIGLGYVNGAWPSYFAIRDGAPNHTVVPITVQAVAAGTILDVESGDATPFQAPGWVLARRAAGIDPWVYCSTSPWPDVIAEFNRQGVALPHFWVAAYPGGGPTIPPGAEGHQWADTGPSGENVDQSVFVDGAFSTPTPTPATVAKERTVLWHTVDQDQNFQVDLAGEQPIVGIAPHEYIVNAAGTGHVDNGHSLDVVQAVKRALQMQKKPFDNASIEAVVNEGIRLGSQ